MLIIDIDIASTARGHWSLWSVHYRMYRFRFDRQILGAGSLLGGFGVAQAGFPQSGGLPLDILLL